MKTWSLRLTAIAAIWVAAAIWVGAIGCSSSAGESPPAATDAGSDAAVAPETSEIPDITASPDVADDVVPQPDALPQPDTSAPPPTVCDTLGLEALPWSTGPYGTARHELADDFTIPQVDGTSFSYKATFTGCDSVVILPDTLPNSEVDTTSVWARDVDRLIADSPRNAHYVFVSRLQGEAAKTAASQMFGRVLTALDALSPEDRTFWRAHLHVSAVGAADLDSWLSQPLRTGIGQLGLAIDTTQRVRGVGSLADVTRQINVKDGWPFEANLAYAANEARHFNAERRRDARLAAETATVVPLWTGEVVAEFAEKEVLLPTAAEMATFDGLEIDIEQRCPDATKPEVGNCGAWDYLSYLWVYDGELRRELGRGITTYHREGRWIIDATPMLPWLAAGGARKFRWEWAPSWNTQPTGTLVSLRFLKRGTASHPTEVHPLFTGGGFGSTYNDGREPITVTVPAGATRVELYAVITGHGAGTSQCAEFCRHAHEFTVDGQVFMKEHPDPGSLDGCAKRIEDGVVPNQWGTWWFGRGGWCPGQQVDAYRVDVTDLAKDGTLTVTYRGLLNGTNPPDGAGDINLTSAIVVWQAQ
jgi:hypothetical protein